jgi:hypothetical protein
VTARKSFLLRIDPAILEALQRWADADLRSLNGQIEFVLRRTLEQEGRLPNRAPAPDGRTGTATRDGESDEDGSDGARGDSGAARS